MRKFLVVVLMLFSSLAIAQNFPKDKVITLVVPFPAGGPTDRVARDLSPILAKKLGQEVIVENWSGAGGSIALKRIAHGVDKNGYTIVIGNLSLATYPAVYKNLGFDAKADLIPLASIANVPQVLVVNRDFKAKTFPEFIDFAKKNPGKINLAHAGDASPSHLGSILLQSKFGITVTDVPYKGTAPALIDVIGGQVDAHFAQTTSLGGGIIDRVRPIAVSSSKRLPELPNVPAINATGTGFEIVIWHGVFAPKGIPTQAQTALVKALEDSVNSGDFKSKMKALGAQVPADTSPAAMTKTLDEQQKFWIPLLKSAGIKQE